MRVSAPLILLLAPRLLVSLTLAQTGPLALGDGGADPLPAASRLTLQAAVDLPFFLPVSAEAHAEGAGLRHLGSDAGAAPEAFFDGTFLGPLLVEHGLSWRSPDLALAPGRHHLILRNASVEDADDLTLERLSVKAEGLKAPVAPHTGIAPVKDGCVGRARRDWPERLPGGIKLSVMSGKVASSGPLVTLKEGQSWECRLRIPASAGQPLPLLASFQPILPGGARWIFSLDPDPPARVDALGYQPGAFERLRIEHCPGRLTLRFAQAPPLSTPWAGGDADVELAAQGLEIDLRAAQ